MQVQALEGALAVERVRDRVVSGQWLLLLPLRRPADIFFFLLLRPLLHLLLLLLLLLPPPPPVHRHSLSHSSRRPGPGPGGIPPK